jgi:uncharacterized membrane protein YcaP (DUF421 family)
MYSDYLRIIFSSITVYLFIIIAIRLFGKKELAQLSVIDLVFILLISNAVQNAMVGADSSLMGGLIAAGSLFIVNHLFKLLMYKFPRFNQLVEGEAILLVYKGELIELLTNEFARFLVQRCLLLLSRSLITAPQANP